MKTNLKAVGAVLMSGMVATDTRAQTSQAYSDALDWPVTYITGNWATSAWASRDGVDALASGRIPLSSGYPRTGNSVNAFTVKGPGLLHFYAKDTAFTVPNEYFSACRFVNVSGLTQVGGVDGQGWVHYTAPLRGGANRVSVHISVSSNSSFINDGSDLGLSVLDNLSVVAYPATTIEAAVDLAGPWTTSAAGSWLGVTADNATASDSVDYAYAEPPTTAGTPVWMQRSFTGPVRVRWDWMANSASTLQAKVDGVLRRTHPLPHEGTAGNWRTAYVDLSDGSHTLRFEAVAASGELMAGVDKLTTEPTLSIGAAVEQPSVAWTVSPLDGWLGEGEATNDYAVINPTALAQGTEATLSGTFTGPLRVSWAGYASSDSPLKVHVDGVLVRMATTGSNWVDLPSGNHLLAFSGIAGAGGTPLRIDTITTGPLPSFSILGGGGSPWTSGGSVELDSTTTPPQANLVSGASPAFLETTFTGPGHVTFVAIGKGQAIVGDAALLIAEPLNFRHARLSIPAGLQTVRWQALENLALREVAFTATAATSAAALDIPNLPVLEVFPASTAPSGNAQVSGAAWQGGIALSTAQGQTVAVPAGVPGTSSVVSAKMAVSAPQSGTLSVGDIALPVSFSGSERYGLPTSPGSHQSVRFGFLGTMDAVTFTDPIPLSVQSAFGSTSFFTEAVFIGTHSEVGVPSPIISPLLNAVILGGPQTHTESTLQVNVVGPMELSFRRYGSLTLALDGVTKGAVSSLTVPVGEHVISFTNPATKTSYVNLLSATLPQEVSLSEALDGGTWTAGGDRLPKGYNYRPWLYDADFVAVPGLLPGQKAWVETVLTGSFAFVGSAAPAAGDRWSLEVDGVLQASSSGAFSEVVVVPPTTTHRYRFIFERSSSASGPSDPPILLQNVSPVSSPGPRPLTEFVGEADLHVRSPWGNNYTAYPVSGEKRMFVHGPAQITFEHNLSMPPEFPIWPPPQTNPYARLKFVVDGQSVAQLTSSGTYTYNLPAGLHELRFRGEALGLDGPSYSNVWVYNTSINYGNTAYTAWASAANLPGFSMYLDSDSDKDGLSNALEFMLGTPPQTGNVNPLQITNLGSAIRLSYPVPTHALGSSTMTLQVSPNLQQWMDAPPATSLGVINGHQVFETPVGPPALPFSRLKAVIAR